MNKADTAPCWNELEELNNKKADPEETLSKGITRNFSYTEAGNKDCVPSAGKFFSYASLGVKPCHAHFRCFIVNGQRLQCSKSSWVLNGAQFCFIKMIWYHLRHLRERHLSSSLRDLSYTFCHSKSSSVLRSANYVMACTWYGEYCSVLSIYLAEMMTEAAASVTSMVNTPLLEASKAMLQS